ncbi:MAG: hypothetical protein ACREPR_20655, partial [Brasilonema sp.]
MKATVILFPVFMFREVSELNHDKRWVIAKALELFDACIFIDSNARILKPIPDYPEWINMPGIQAKSCFKMSRHYSTVYSGKVKQAFIKEFDTVV